MFDPEVMHSTVESKQATPEDATIWVSVTRRSADQMPLESEDAQIARYKEENIYNKRNVSCSGAVILPLDAYASTRRVILPNWMDLYFCLRLVAVWQRR
jgi:hypothetical protein